MLLVFTLLAACAGPGYYWQAARGQWALSRAAEPVEDVLADPATPESLLRNLAATRRMLAFASQRLALPAAGAYTRWVATGREAVVWNVVAAPEFSVTPETWCFPVAGCVAYRGYFSRHGADRFAQDLRDRGLDVAVVPATAYSTLGWFDDPLLDTMLRGGEMRTAAVLFHELAHRRVYAGGDTAFSESYARYVERLGVSEWLIANGRDADLPRWRRALAMADRGEALLLDARRNLENLYASEIPPADMRARKQAILAQLAAGLDREAGSSEAWIGDAPNNAHVALAASYASGQCHFDALLDSVGGDVRAFHDAVEQLAAAKPATRSAWLNAPCPEIAPPGDL